MEYRKLGKTDEKVSTIGMGTWMIGTYANEEEKREQVQALTKGLELGINLIDTAEAYGDGDSERLVGEVTRGRRDSVFIATKVRPRNLHHDDVITACEASLKRLGTNYVDLYQVHWPNPRVPIAETMGAMEELVRQGKVRYVGVSNFSVEQTEEARAALRRSELASNQVEYSLTNRKVEGEILPYCKKERIALIAYSPLAKGAIADSMVPLSLQQKYTMTPAQVMLNWVTRHEDVFAIPKSAKAGHIEENAASVSVRFSDSEYGLIK